VNARNEKQEMTVKRIRIDKPRITRERPGPEDLPADPRDPDVVRAKALARSQPPCPRSNAAAGTTGGL
jgi:hypothetical protein